MQSSNEGSAPRPAATLVLLRDGNSGPEVLLTVRPKTMRFMGGAAVFPGGALAPADLDPRWEAASSLSRASAARALGDLDGAAALGAYVCALREAFEEVGFTLATGPVEHLDRRAAEDPERWLETCLGLGVTWAADALVPVGRWITPVASPIRFDARFFAVRAPAGWEPVPDPREVEACMWVTSSHALEELGRGALTMGPPTVETLQRMEGAASVDEVLARLTASAVGDPGHLAATRLHPLVLVVTAPNPGPMTGPGTNTYIVGRAGESSCVIDPAVDDPAYIEVVAAAAGRLERIVVTHRHPDHVGGVVALEQRTGAPVNAFGDADINGVAVVSVADGDELTAGGVRLRVLHAPGHASDHICLHLGELLFTGDNILGEGTAVIAPPDGDMRAYLDTLHRLRKLDVKRLFPGHFRPRYDASSLIDDYISHRAERERAILHALGPLGATVEEIVSRVYADTPVSLHPLAAYSVQAHLELAEDDGRVEQVGGRWVVKA